MTTYYVSNAGNDSNPGNTSQQAWATLALVNSKLVAGEITHGDIVLFRCGDTFYGNLGAALAGPAYATGVTFGSYGTGARPIITRYKVCNTAAGWVEHTIGVWKVDVTQASGAYTGNTVSTASNAGFIKVDGGIKGAKKSSLDALAQPWDFYSDTTHLYVKASANPTTLAADIRMAPDGAICVPTNGTTLTGLELVGSGGHGVAVSSTSTQIANVTISDCAIHETGGSYMPSSTTRYGNGVEGWIGTTNLLVTGCEIYDVYDVAITYQGPVNATNTAFTNLHSRYNRIWNCNQAFEVWSNIEASTGGFIKCSFSHNVVVRSGHSWGDPVRPDKDGTGTDLLLYKMFVPTDIEVTGNVFLGAKDNFTFSTNPIPVGYRSHHNHILLNAGTKLQHQRSETIANHAAWVAATGQEVGSTFHILPPLGTVQDALNYLAAFVGTAGPLAEISRRHAAESFGRLLNEARPVASTPSDGAPLTSGIYYTPRHTALVSENTVNTLRGASFVPGRSTRLTRIACRVVTAGTAGAVVRLGVYRDAGLGRLDLLVDAGTVDATTTGDKELTINTPVYAGDNLWLCAAIQGGAATPPVIRATDAMSNPQTGSSNLTFLLDERVNGISVPMAGAFSSTIFPGSIGGTSKVFKLAVRAG